MTVLTGCILLKIACQITTPWENLKKNMSSGDYPTDPPLQYPQIDLTREAEESDPPVVGTHP